MLARVRVATVVVTPEGASLPVVRQMRREPEVLILDEATSSLDDATQSRIASMIEESQLLESSPAFAQQENLARVSREE